ncbi:MAG: DciA family protein [Bifidobacteriaceae bacterium]|nr:DciA family protein [Bifidobacteriaceae bacterium]
MGDALDNLVTERGWESQLRDAEVMARFSDVVGADIAAHATPRSFDDDVLVIQAVDAVWATQLRLLIPQLLARYADVLGTGSVTAIHIVGPSAPKRGRRRFTVR